MSHSSLVAGLVAGVAAGSAAGDLATPVVAEAIVVEAAPERKNRRAFPRVGVDCPASIMVLSGAGTIIGRLSDLSLGGCRMVTAAPVTVGILARVEVSFDLRGYSFRMVGVTAGTRAKTSFAVRFLEMSKRRAEELSELLGEVTANPEGPRQAAREEMVAPMLEAVKERAAAEQPVAGAAGLNPAGAGQAGSGPVGLGAAGGGDRRGHPRHGVDTRVNLTLIRGAITMPGCILNLSQGGCRLRTDERFNVGIYTRVEAEFFLHGMPFRLAGVSQAILDKNTIGIRFLDMSERKRAQLTELIAEIEEMQEEGARD